MDTPRRPLPSRPEPSRSHPRVIHDVHRAPRTMPAKPVIAHEPLDHYVKAEILTRALKNHQEKHQPKRRRLLTKQAGFVTAAVMALIITGYVVVDTIAINAHVKQQVVTATPTTTAADATQAQEGTDTTPIAPSALDSYTVAPDLPRALYISKLNIAARILPMGVNDDGSVQAPQNSNDSGWYTGSQKPNQPGALFIDGHSSGSTHKGLFGNLDSLVIGDTIKLEQGDHTMLTYRVIHTEVIDLKDVDMSQLLVPYNGVTKGLNLMTCTGNWINDGGDKTLDKRVVVFTEQVL